MVFTICLYAQPPDAVFFDSYGQPEGCQQDDCDVYVEWRRNGEFIDFRMEGDGSGWIALGITADNSPLNRVSNTLLMVPRPTLHVFTR